MWIQGEAAAPPLTQALEGIEGDRSFETYLSARHESYGWPNACDLADADRPQR